MISMHAMDACELLDADHVAVKHLFVDYARLAMAAPEGSGAERRELADRICRELTVHAQIEEELFYPALQRARREAGGLLEDAKREHQQAKDLVAQIESYGDPDPGMDALVLGFLVWGDVPNALAWAGIALLVGAGIVVLHAPPVIPA